MPSNQKTRIRELVDHALQLPLADRAPFLDQACGADTALRAEAARALVEAGPGPQFLFPTLPVGADRSEAPTVPHDPLSGKRIGPYQVKRLIGSGGMGSVYLAARVDDFEHQVALKLVRRGLDTEEFVQRFRGERQVLAGLNHPNIARLLDGGTTEDGRPYLVMEHVDGQPIDRYCDGRRLPTRERVRILRAVCAAVHHAHQHTVIHRDLKPGNVLLTADGTPKVVDFGLAKRAEGAGDTPHSLTATGAVVGTPSYMAPEQAGGKGREVGPAADVYSLGAILYELLTGRPPFRAETPLDTLLQVLHAEPVPPGRLHAHLPRDLETICLKCLQKDPARRYPSAQALEDDLGRFLAGEPIHARPVGRAERLWRWCRRYPVVAGLTAAVAVLLVAVVVGALLTARREQRLRSETEQANADLERALYSQSIAVADMELTLRNDVGLAEELLDRCPEHLRGWEWHYMRRQLDGARPPLTGHTAGVWCVAFSPDGRRVASGSIDGTVKVWESATGRLLRTFRGHLPAVAALLPDNTLFPVMCVAFSPDGKRIASGCHELKLSDFRNPSGVVKVWEVETGKEVRAYRGHARLVIGIAFRPDGRQIASSSFDHTVHLWDPATGKTAQVLKGHTDWVNRVSYSPDGRRLASPGMDGLIKIWDTATGRELESLDGHGPVRDVEYSRDGRWLAAAGMDGSVTLRDAATGQVRRVLRGHSGSAFGVAFSPDGRRLASAGFDKTVRVWDVATGKETITLRGHGDLVWSVAFSPDGRRLVSGSWDKTVRVWDATPLDESAGPKVLTLVGHPDRVNRLAFSPDGRRLATAGWDNLVRVWDVATGKELFHLKGHTSGVISVAFSPDRRMIATASWDRTARVWDADTGRPLHVYRGHGTLVHGVAFSPDSRSVATSSVDGIVKVWDPATGAERYALRAHMYLAYCVAFSPDGKLLATAGGDRVVKLFDARTGKGLRTLRGHDMVVYDVAFSPDSRQVVSASWDKTLRRWDVATGKEVGVYRGHQDHVHAVAFTPDGARLVSASEDKTVRIWDAKTFRQLGPPRLHRGAVWSVAVSRDGKRVASACWYPKGWVKIWPMPK